MFLEREGIPGESLFELLSRQKVSREGREGRKRHKAIFWPLVFFGVGVDVRTRFRGKSGTQELRKEIEKWGFTAEETDELGDWSENCRAVVWLQN
jgi:hypothetical protein